MCRLQLSLCLLHSPLSPILLLLLLLFFTPLPLSSPHSLLFPSPLLRSLSLCSYFFLSSFVFSLSLSLSLLQFFSSFPPPFPSFLCFTLIFSLFTYFSSLPILFFHSFIALSNSLSFSSSFSSFPLHLPPPSPLFLFLLLFFLPSFSLHFLLPSFLHLSVPLFSSPSLCISSLPLTFPFSSFTSHSPSYLFSLTCLSFAVFFRFFIFFPRNIIQENVRLPFLLWFPLVLLLLLPYFFFVVLHLAASLFF